MGSTTLFVSNFPFAITESDLRTTFEEYYTVSSIRIITDRQTGRSRGFAFIEVADETGGDQAIEALNESMFHGRRLVVSRARGRAGTAGGARESPPSSSSIIEPFKHRIVVDWCEDEHEYAAEVPDLGLSARAETIEEAVRRVQGLRRRSAAGAGSGVG